MAKPVTSVFYNDGEHEDLFALVKHDDGNGNLDLIIFTPQGVSSAVNNVPRREKDDYDAAGGGVTYHTK